MHDYAIDEKKRRRVNVIIVGLYVLASPLIACLNNGLEGGFRSLADSLLGRKIADSEWIYISTVLSMILPAIEVGLFFKIYDHFIWKCFIWLHKIPNLNGKWVAEIKSPLKGGYKPEIHMEIRQTWNKIQVNGMSARGTATESVSASIVEERGELYFSYSYWIHHNGEQHYPGFNSLRIRGEEMSGEYFSSKNVEKNLKESGLDMIENQDVKEQIVKRIGGCGSKGIIVLRREY